MTRNCCKFILVLLVCAAPLVAAVVNAETVSNPPGGLYALAAADQGANGRQAAANDRQVQSKPGSPDSPLGLAAEERPSGSMNTLPSGDRGWIVAVAAAGLVLSLAAAGFLAWSRSRQAEAPVLLPHGLAHSSENSPAADTERRPERRAA